MHASSGKALQRIRFADPASRQRVAPHHPQAWHLGLQAVASTSAVPSVDQSSQTTISVIGPWAASAARTHRSMVVTRCAPGSAR